MKDTATRGFMCLCAVGLAAALQASAPPVPQFTGTYDVQNVRPQPQDNVRVPDPPKAGEIPLPPDFRPQVKLQLGLTIDNPFDGDVTNATVELQDTQFALRKHATSQNVNFKKKDQASVSMELQMPLPEYQGWQQGEAPNVFIIFTDAQGVQRRQKVWLTAGSAPKGGN